MTSAQVLGLTFALSGCSLLYELTIAGCYVAFTGDSPFWQSVTIGIYLAALGLGAWTCSRWSPGLERRRLWLVELGLTAAGAASAIALLLFESGFWVWQHFYTKEQAGALPVLAALLSGQAVTVLIGWLSGFELPLLMRLGREAEGRDLSREVLAASYLGSLGAGLAFSFWLLPAFDVAGTAAIASAVNLAACVWLRRDRWSLPGNAAAGLAWAGCLAIGPLVGRFNAASFHAGRLGVPQRLNSVTCCRPPSVSLPKVLRGVADRMDAVERVPSRVQRIEVVERGHQRTYLSDYFNRRPRTQRGLDYGKTLHLDRRFQFWAAAEAVYHEHLAHVPIQLFRRVPEEVLILGGGDGLLAKEFLKYGDRVRRVVNVELDPAMVRLAKEEPWLRRLNGDAFHDPTVEVVTADAFAFVRAHPRRYDAVYIDFPFPYSYDTAKLYSAEFFRNVAALLRPGGFAAMDYPLASNETMAEAGPEGLRRNSIAVNTLREGRFRTIVPYSAQAAELLTTGRAIDLGLDVAESDADEEIGRLQRRFTARRFHLRHPTVPVDLKQDLQVVRNEAGGETMLAFTLERAEPNFRFVDHGIELYALNPLRLALLEGGSYPYVEDKKLVNRVVRPTLFKSLRIQRR